MKGEYLAPDIQAEGSVKVAPIFRETPEAAALYREGKYIGGFVQEPECGFHDMPTTTYDFASLYPSIMRGHNLCNTTYLRREEDAKKMGFTPDQYHVALNGFCFVKKHVKKALTSTLLEGLLDARKTAKKERDKYPPGSVEYDIWENRQTAYKVCANAVYGQQGAPTNPAGNMPVAEAVTTYGRNYINAVKDYLNSNYAHWGRVIYGDTDSLMFKFESLPCFEPGGQYHGFDCSRQRISNEMMPVVVAEARVRSVELAEAINKRSGIFEAPMEMAFEKILMRFLLLAAKKYAAAKYEPAGPVTGKLLVQGLESKRRDNPLFAANRFKTLLEMMLVHGASEGELLAFAEETMRMILNNEVPLKGLVMSQGISKPLHEYAGAQAHVNVARLLIAAGYPVVPGDRVDMVFLHCHETGRAEKAFPAKLFNPAVHVLDFAFYARYITGPFERALQYILSDEARARLWSVDGYERLVPSRTSGRFGPLARVFDLGTRVYEVKRSRTAAQPATERALKQTRFM